MTKCGKLREEIPLDESRSVWVEGWYTHSDILIMLIHIIQYKMEYKKLA